MQSAGLDPDHRLCPANRPGQGVIQRSLPLIQATTKSLSRDLHDFAEEATDHLKDAASKTGSEASDAIARSTRAITRAADRLRHEAETSAATTRAQVSETVRAYPVSTSVVAGAILALLATFALVRLSQS